MQLCETLVAANEKESCSILEKYVTKGSSKGSELIVSSLSENSSSTKTLTNCLVELQLINLSKMVVLLK